MAASRFLIEPFLVYRAFPAPSCTSDWGAAVLLATVVFSYVPQDVAWRVLFAVGLLPALLIIYVRRGIPEPRRGEKKTAANESVLDNLAGIFRPNVLRSTMIGGLFGRGQCTSPRTLRL